MPLPFPSSCCGQPGDCPVLPEKSLDRERGDIYTPSFVQSLSHLPLHSCTEFTVLSCAVLQLSRKRERKKVSSSTLALTLPSGVLSICRCGISAGMGQSRPCAGDVTHNTLLIWMDVKSNINWVERVNKQTKKTLPPASVWSSTISIQTDLWALRGDLC